MERILPPAFANRIGIAARLRLLALPWLLTLVLATSATGGEGGSGSTADLGAYETDRPGEVENPFAIAPGRAELVNYVVGLNAAARAAGEFGDGGSAVILDTAVRFGVSDRVEGAVTLDTFLSENPSADSGSGASGGLGYATLLAKWNFLRGATGDFGVALAPLVRLPLSAAIDGTRRPGYGLIVPFDFDLEGGWELQGSSGVSWSPAEGGWSTQWENQASLERRLTEKLTAYLELQLESGDGLPAWSTEFGAAYRLNGSILIDLGGSLGIGKQSRGKMIYTGVGWAF